MHCIRILVEAHRVRGAPISRPPSLMTSAFAALISVHLVSTRILMKYSLHADTGRGAPIPRRTESYAQHICCTGQWPHRFQSNTDGVCIAYGYWRRRTESEAHLFRGAPRLMSSIFAALVSGRLFSTLILMKYSLHAD